MAIRPAATLTPATNTIIWFEVGDGEDEGENKEGVAAMDKWFNVEVKGGESGVLL